MSDPRWAVDEDEHASTVWFDLGNGETFEPWEALPGTVDEQNQLGAAFDAAYDALVECVRSHDTLPAALDVIRRFRDGWKPFESSRAWWWTKYTIDRGDDGIPDEPMTAAEAAVMDLLTGEGQ